MMMNHSTAGCFMTHVEMTSQMMSFDSRKLNTMIISFPGMMSPKSKKKKGVFAYSG
jgi:hypothetical protein